MLFKLVVVVVMRLAGSADVCCLRRERHGAFARLHSAVHYERSLEKYETHQHSFLCACC